MQLASRYRLVAENRLLPSTISVEMKSEQAIIVKRVKGVKLSKLTLDARCLKSVQRRLFIIIKGQDYRPNRQVKSNMDLRGVKWTFQFRTLPSNVD